MYFHDEKQRHAVCRALLATIGRADLWTETGPTEDAERLDEADGTDFEERDRALFRLVWDLHHPHRGPRVTLNDLRFKLSAVPQLAVLRLLLAYASRGSRGVDVWLSEVEQVTHLDAEQLDGQLLGRIDAPFGANHAIAILDAARRSPDADDK